MQRARQTNTRCKSNTAQAQEKQENTGTEPYFFAEIEPVHVSKSTEQQILLLGREISCVVQEK